MSSYTHLHNHSHYSLRDGLCQIKPLIERAKQLEFQALALTDHGSCGGLFSFRKECKNAGIKPILGMEAYITDDHESRDKESKTYHLTVLAKNKIGYKNLIKLSSLGYTKGFYKKPRIDFKQLQAHKDGLIILSGCRGGEVGRALEESADDTKAIQIVTKYKDLFQDDYYCEIMFHRYGNPKETEIERQIAVRGFNLSKKLSVQSVLTNDVHYINREDWKSHDVLLAIQNGGTIKDPDRFTYDTSDLFLKSYEEMQALARSQPSLLMNSMLIADKIEPDVMEISKELLLPDFKIPPGFNSQDDFLKSLVVNGLKEKGLFDKDAYKERARYEMKVILECKFTKYFLILWDIVNFAKMNDIITGVGRGSGAGSLVLYTLGITKLDPIKYDLLFERFLNPERVSPPDVDMDFDYDRRQEVYDYIVSKYGAEYCTQIGTYNTYKAKGVIRSVCKALDVGGDWEINKQYKEKGIKNESKKSLDIADAISKAVPDELDVTIESSLKDSDEFRSYMSKYPELLRHCRTLEGTNSSAGTHAAGIIICKDPITEHVPQRLYQGVISSQYDKDETESMGLLKYDLLAIKTLTVIDKTAKMIKRIHGEKAVPDLDLLDPIDLKVLSSLNTILGTKGVFQFESDGISKLLADIHVDTFEDMIVANALYRPGPLGAKVHTKYCDYKHKKKEIEYLHPKMGDVLKKTYGIMIYQEDIMQISRALAGFTRGQADTLRKVIGKKKPELIKKEKLDDLFIDGCKKGNIDGNTARKIFDQIKFFGGYGFNRCLLGDTMVLDKVGNKTHTLSELAETFSPNGSRGEHVEDVPFVLDSYVDGKIVEDEIVEVFETGEQEVYEVELDNGMIIKCTMEHKFYCSDGGAHELREIIEKGLEILCEEKSNEKVHGISGENMQKSKIISVKSLGKQKTYNVTMKSDQHNYKIVDSDGRGVYTKNSHSASYAFVAYQTAWLKVYYPTEYMCNLLTSVIDDEDQFEIYRQTAVKMGIGVLDPDVNSSGLEMEIQSVNGHRMLRKPLAAIKGVGGKAAQNIVENRPYKGMKDFILKTDGRLVNTKVFATLVTNGCMHSWHEPKQKLIEQYPEAKKALAKERKKIGGDSKDSLFSDVEPSVDNLKI